ncbi:hypothetical protein LZ30DRAFT_710292 [Colletotrichum cereale]|nr:hypothetical protein LZ30DRAFT_710292 [Colletotrichum cereale]
MHSYGKPCLPSLPGAATPFSIAPEPKRAAGIRQRATPTLFAIPHASHHCPPSFSPRPPQARCRPMPTEQARRHRSDPPACAVSS